MSTCWKCGHAVPEGQTECEVCAAGLRRLDMRPTSAELEAEAALAVELKAGDEAFAAAAQHLERMGAGAAQMTVKLASGEYLVFVKRLEAGR